MKLNKSNLLFITLLAFAFSAFAQSKAPLFPESFEKNAKQTFTYDTLNMPSGSWSVYNAIIGHSANDKKNGSQALRIQQQGFITMNYDIVGGPNELSFEHAIYGNDAPAIWAVYSSIDSGKSWIKYKSNIHTTSTTLTHFKIKVAHQKPIRFQIRKISGGRLNIDDISITNSSKVVVYAPVLMSPTVPVINTAARTGGSSCVCTVNDTTPSRDNNMALGNPSNATTATTDSNNYLMNKSQYSLSYNNKLGTANWVSWHLSTAWKGSAARCNCFNQDTALPTGYFKVSTSYYTNTGFDRGHLCPSDDRDSTDVDNRATFFMSNIIPQAPILNQQIWGNLEDYCRKLITQGNELYIIAGGYGSGGTGSLGGLDTAIDNGRIRVYAHCWKVIVVLPNGSNDVSRVSNTTRVIAVDMPNVQTVNAHSWDYYRVTVDAIEAATGYDFLSNISTGIQSVIESQVDTGPTN